MCKRIHSRVSLCAPRGSRTRVICPMGAVACSERADSGDSMSVACMLTSRHGIPPNPQSCGSTQGLLLIGRTVTGLIAPVFSPSGAVCAFYVMGCGSSITVVGINATGYSRRISGQVLDVNLDCRCGVVHVIGWFPLLSCCFSFVLCGYYQYTRYSIRREVCVSCGEQMAVAGDLLTAVLRVAAPVPRLVFPQAVEAHDAVACFAYC